MKVRHIVGLALLAMVAGCATYSAARYSIAADNVTVLRGFRGQTINVGPFTAAEPGKTEITCRAVGPIKTMDGEPFEQFIRKAFIDELMIAEVFSPTAPITLTGYLEAFDFTSSWNLSPGQRDAAWTIALTIASSNGTSLAVREEYRFVATYGAENACSLTAHALMPAVQNLIGKIVRHPDFVVLVKP